MKRAIMFLAFSALIAVMLCGCAQKAENGVKDAASSVESKVKEIFETKADEPTESPVFTEPADNTDPTIIEGVISELATEWQEKVDDGTVEDGDGNVGELEDNDGD